MKRTVLLVTFALAASVAAWIAAGAGGADPVLAVQVKVVTVPVTNMAASQTPATAACPPGTVLVGGGLRAYFAGTLQAGDPYHPINGLVLRGLGTSDAGGALSSDGASDPASWTADGGFAGQNEPNDNVTSFAMCASGGPAHTQVVVSSVPGPSDAQTTATAIATCPSGTRLVGGGAMTTPFSQPSIKPDGSYPSNSSGARTAVSADPDSWSAVGESGGLMSTAGGVGAVTTTALAVCSTDASLHTTVVRAGSIDHPAGPGNGTPGSDAIATATATCPSGTTLLDGGVLATGAASGDDGGNIQQGVHLRGSYPSDGSANPVGDGATNPSSWSAIVQSGGQNTPGTDSFAYALCAQAAPVASTPANGNDGSGSSTGGAGSTTTTSTTITTPVRPVAAFTPMTGASAPKTVTAKHGKAASFTIGSSANPLVVAWPANFAESTLLVTGQLTPAAVSGRSGLASGSAAMRVTVKKGAGGAVKAFAVPLELRFPGAPGNVIAASSADGRTWAGVAKLAPGVTRLAAKAVDGYYRDRLGTLHILTRHAAFFGLVSTATRLSNALTLAVSVTRTLNLSATHTLWLSVTTSRPASIAITLSRSGKVIRSWSSRTAGEARAIPLVLPASALRGGQYELTVGARAGTIHTSRDVSVTFVSS